jgi:isocitrate dehydrogenase (NAD+)
MLDHVGLTQHATALRTAIDDVLNRDKVRTGDLGGKATTRDYAAALVQRVSTLR